MATAFEPRCDVCLNEYSEPRMLPCGHSFCSSGENCLQKILSAEKPQCPLKCEQMESLKGKAIESFPKNFALIISAAVSFEKQTNNLIDLVPFVEFQPPNSSSRRGTITSHVLCKRHFLEENIHCDRCETDICMTCWDEEHSECSVRQIKQSEVIQKETARAEHIQKYVEVCEKLAFNTKLWNELALISDEAKEVEKVFREAVEARLLPEIIQAREELEQTVLSHAQQLRDLKIVVDESFEHLHKSLVALKSFECKSPDKSPDNAKADPG